MGRDLPRRHATNVLEVPLLGKDAVEGLYAARASKSLTKIRPRERSRTARQLQEGVCTDANTRPSSAIMRS